jgi:tetratricopeptide (TPR) repeat protein
VSETKKIVRILNSAVEDFSNSNYDSAAKKLDQILIYQPNNFDALHISGVIQGIKGNHAKAGEYLKKAIKIMPDNSYAHFNLAKSLSELGNELEALPHHLKAIQLAPNNEESWLNYGKSLLNLNKYTESITCFDQILLNNKNSVPALVNKAIALQKLDNNDGALELLNIALKINPTSAIIHNSIGY